MISAFNSLLQSFMRLLVVLLLVVLTPAWGSPAELKLELKLIWGTNDPKSPDPTHKPVAPATATKLRRVFTWTNYFEVKKLTGSVPSHGTKRFEMSNKCTIEISELGGGNVQVTLIGDGQRINKTTHHLNKGECFTIAGGEKNGSAWFVLVTELDQK